MSNVPSPAHSPHNFINTVLATVLFLSTYYLLLPALPLHIQKMGNNKFEIGLIMAVFSVSSLILRPISGRLVDQYGRKTVMLLSIAFYFLTPLLYYLGTNFSTIVLVQILYGFSIGSYTTSSTTYVADIAPVHLVAPILGWFSIAIILAKGLAPALGARFYETHSFMFTVWVSVGIAAVSLLLTARLREQRQQESTARQIQPYYKIITSSMVLLPTITLFCGLITFGVISVMLPLFAHSRGLLNFEYFFVVHTGAVVATRLFTGSSKPERLVILVAGSLLLLTAALVMMSFVHTVSQLLAVAVVYGIGYGALYPALSALLVLYSPQQQRGSALGFFTAAFDLGVSGGTFLGGFSEFIGFSAVYLAASLLPLAGLLLFVLLYLPRLQEQLTK